MKKSSLSLLHKALFAVLVLLLPIFITFMNGYYKSREALKKDTLDDLTVMAESYEGQVYQFLEMSRRRVHDFSSDGVITGLVERFIKGDNAAANSLREYLLIQKFPLDSSLSRISIASIDGRVITSTDPDYTGRDVSDEVFFMEGKTGLYITEIQRSPTPEIAASAPLYSKTDGRLIGVITDFFSLSELNTLLTGEFNRRLGAVSWSLGKQESMEIYLVNRDMLMITESRFIKNAILRVPVRTPPVIDCLKNGKEMAGYYRDYRGVEVAGSSMCLPSMRWALIAEVDSDEVLAPVLRLKKDALAAVFIVAGIIGVVFAAFYRVIIARLREVSSASASLARGDLDAAVPVHSGDEIGELSESFNTMARDIKNRTALLRESEERLRAIIDNSLAVIYLKDSAGKYLLINRRYEALFGVRNADIHGRTDFEIFPMDVAASFRANDLKVLEAGHPMEFEELVPQEDGVHYYISMKVPITGPDGRPFATCGISTDITERRLAQEKVKRLNRLYSVLSKINEAIIRHRNTGRLFEETCRVAVEDGGFLLAWVGVVDRQSMLVRPVAHYGSGGYLDDIRISVKDAPEGRGPTGTAVREGRNFICNDIENDPLMAPWRERALERGFRSSASLPLKVGERVMGALNIYAGEPGFFDDEEIGLMDALSSDISFAIESIEIERQAKRADEELRLLQAMSIAVSEAKDFHAALKVAITKVCEATGWAIGEVWVPRADGGALEYVSAWYGSGAEVEDFIRFSRKLVFPRGAGLPGRVWAARGPEWVTDLSKNGVLFLRSAIAAENGLVAGFGIPIISGADVLAILVFFMREATEEDRRLVDLVSAVSAQLGAAMQKKIAEEARLEMQRKYEDLVNNLNVGIYRTTVGDEGRFMEFNRAFMEILEAGSREEITAHSASDFYPEKARRRELGERLISQGYVKDEEVELVTLKGRRIWVSISAATKAGKDGEVFFDGVIEDITEHKKLREQLAQAQKMEAVGQLAGGIAHDFNNILTAIIGYGNLLNMKKGEDTLIRNYADHILTLSEKAASLTQGLLAFSRKQVLNPQPMELNELIRRVEKILARVIGEDIELKTAYSETGLIVRADATQIEQVIINLATNARDAMPNGGILSITTSAAELGEDYVERHHYGTPGAYALITFSDTGVGMDEKTLKRVFEPFFTTKEVGKGTGLGLSMVYGTVKQHNGLINVYSEPGRGTTFRIFLPLAPQPVPETPPLARAELKGGTETVLLAEDEPDVRKITRTMIEEYGYRVIMAENGEDAVRKFMENRDEVKLLIMDLIMPKMNGREAYEEIKKIRPGVKALFTSGYASDIMKSKGILEGDINFLSKPVSLGVFLKKIREVLDS